ncbi:ketopantoate reductase family protein [Draconibacterium sp. IB214405]|uniref:ketopantoate reductase family protein n=1 Tax=Draconibacterium sp. IB214405 TaxID=3097352 RepID=UPI002A13FB45|nr:ketopantoate reductase family protein [Draconibacterium sp. IB214405]MDX8339869.1 ketopantoate reductase family protein [Draconibacterium sp. IB214405]
MSKTISKVSIIGLGALGILYGEHFLRRMPGGNLRIIADPKRIDKYKKDGIYCNEQVCEFDYVSPDAPVDPADLLIVAVKYNALADAIRMIKGHVGPDTIILSVLNGVVSEAEIGEVYGDEHLLYTVAQGMTASKVGNKMSYRTKGILSFGELDAVANSEKVERVKAFFDKVELPYEINNRMKHKLWSKWMLNVGINQTVAYFNATNDLVQKSGEARNMMIDTMKEAIAVANKEGVNLSQDDIDYWLKIIDTLAPNERPSMAQDVLAGRSTEVALFAGTVVKRAKKHAVSVPLNEQFLKYFS